MQRQVDWGERNLRNGENGSPVGTAFLPALSNNSGEENQKDSQNERNEEHHWVSSTPLTSYSPPFGIHDDGKFDLVPRADEREDVVYIDLVPREDLLRVDTSHQD